MQFQATLYRWDDDLLVNQHFFPEQTLKHTHTQAHTHPHTWCFFATISAHLYSEKKGKGPLGKGNYYRWLSRVMCRLDWCRNGKQHLIEHKLPAREIFKVENRYIRQMFSFSQGRCSLEQCNYFSLLLFFSTNDLLLWYALGQCIASQNTKICIIRNKTHTLRLPHFGLRSSALEASWRKTFN